MTNAAKDLTGIAGGGGGGGGGGTASASSDAHDANTTTESSKLLIEELAVLKPQGNNMSATAKSKTLPEGTCLRHGMPKHQRSLSESKTTDVISLIAGSSGLQPQQQQHHHQHRTRYNSCTDSNTSGVSSCESVAGRIGVK